MTLMNAFSNHRAEPYFTFVKNGQKTIEGRIRKGKYQSIAPGDTITVQNLDETDSINVVVTRVVSYDSLSAMLATEDLNKILPNAKNIKDGIRLYREFYSLEQEQEFGVVAFGFDLVK